jgi:hypothetical protein
MSNFNKGMFKTSTVSFEKATMNYELWKKTIVSFV